MSKEEIIEALKSIKIRCHSKSMKYDPIDFDLDIVEKSLKVLEIIKEKNANMFGFKRDIKQLGNRFTYKYYQSNLGNYHSGFDIQELTEEEFNLLKEILE